MESKEKKEISSLTKACKKVNVFFGLDTKFNFSDSDQSENKNEQPSNKIINSVELISLFQWSIQNIDHIMKDHHGANYVCLLLLEIKTWLPNGDDYSDEDHELEGIRWPFDLLILLIDLFDTFGDISTLRRDVDRFYRTRAILFEISRLLLYGNDVFFNIQSNTARKHLNDLCQECYPLLSSVLMKLPSSSQFNMKPKIKKEHDWWLNTVARFYFIEYTILTNGFDKLSSKDLKTATYQSITLERKQYDPMVVYHLGFVGDCVNAAYGMSTGHVFERPIVGSELDYIYNLCRHLMKNMKDYCMIKVKDYGFSNSWGITTWDESIHSIIEMGERGYSVDGKIRELASFLSYIIHVIISVSGHFYARSLLNPDVVSELTKADNVKEVIFDSIHWSMQNILEMLLINKEDKKHMLEWNESLIVNELRDLQKSCFEDLVLFCADFGKIFVLSEEHTQKHKQWIVQTLNILKETPEKLKKILVAKKVLRLKRLLTPNTID